VPATDLPFAVPARPGSYILILRVEQTATLDVGRLGKICLARGWYGYVGSALGPGGLAGRVKHHLSSRARPRWHIDYLRDIARLEAIWVSTQPVRREHDWARLLEESGDAGIGVHSFGSSDCRCASHLLRWNGKPSARRFGNRLRAIFPDDAPLRLLPRDHLKSE